jgi:folate-dependent phosphoribosylglycinamide formyltransferase PurN
MSRPDGSPLQLGVLIGGGGRTLANLVERIRAGSLDAEIAVVIARRADLPGVHRARELGLTVEVIAPPGSCGTAVPPAGLGDGVGSALTLPSPAPGHGRGFQSALTPSPFRGHPITHSSATPSPFRGHPLTHSSAAPSSPPSIDDRITAALVAHRVDLVVLAGYLKPLRVDPPFVGKVMNIHPALLPAFGGKGMYGMNVHRAVLASGSRESGCTVHFVDEVYDNGPIILQERCEVRRDDTAETLAARVFALECEAYPRAIGLYAAGRLRIEGRTVAVVPGGRESGGTRRSPHL